MRAVIVSTVKNEGSFLLEWLAHHRACGFGHFLIASNDCSDGTDLMLDRLQDMGWLTHLRNPGPHAKGAHWSALKAADSHEALRGADWVLTSDVDEFVNIHAGGRALGDLLRALPDADAIALTWRMFGNDGVAEYADRPVTEAFTRAAPVTLAWPWRAQMYKTLFRPARFDRLGIHRPQKPLPGPAPRWFDGSGREVTDSLSEGRLYSDYRQDNYALAQLNHYALGSLEGYLVKVERGRANRQADGLDLGYFVERNLCEAEDLSIAGLDSAPLRAELMADAVLGPLHHGAVAWRRARIAALLAQEDWRALFARLMMLPPSRALDASRAALLHRHLRR